MIKRSFLLFDKTKNPGDEIYSYCLYDAYLAHRKTRFIKIKWEFFKAQLITFVSNRRNDIPWTKGLDQTYNNMFVLTKEGSYFLKVPYFKPLLVFI